MSPSGEIRKFTCTDKFDPIEFILLSLLNNFPFKK